MKKNTAKIQNRNQNSHAASQDGGGEAEPSFEYKDSRLQTLLDLAHDGDEIARTELELIWELA
jgi:hypothetical protein